MFLSREKGFPNGKPFSYFLDENFDFFIDKMEKVY